MATDIDSNIWYHAVIGNREPGLSLRGRKRAAVESNPTEQKQLARNTMSTGAQTISSAQTLSSAQRQLPTRLIANNATDGVRHLDLLITDMRCASCAARIESALSKPGIRRVSVNPVRQVASVNYDPDCTTPQAILQAVEDSGYQVCFLAQSSRDPALIAARRLHLKRLGVAGIAMMQVMMYSIALYAGYFEGIAPLYEQVLRFTAWAFTTPVVFYAAPPFFINAWHSLRGLRHTKTRADGLAMDVPVAIAIATAYAVSSLNTVTGTGDTYFDSVTMFTFLLLGVRYLEQGLRHRLAGYDELLNLIPDQALRIGAQGETEKISVQRLVKGDQVRVLPGSQIPCDGRVLQGYTHVDESALTGEASWINKQVGASVYAGTINLSEAVDVEVAHSWQHNRLNAIAQLAQRAQQERSTSAHLSERVAGYFVATVLLLAALTFLFWQWINPEQAMTATLAILVISCPCALSLATPAAITAAATSLRRFGLIITRAHLLDRLACATRVVFDKTGTLTLGTPILTRVIPCASLDSDQCLHIAAALETRANHPLARAIQNAAEQLHAHQSTSAHQKIDMRLDQVRNHPGLGVAAQLDGTDYRLGSAIFCGCSDTCSTTKTVFLSDSHGLLCRFEFNEQLRADAAETVAQLRQQGLAVELLSGDHSEAASEVAQQLAGIPTTSDASPELKLTHIRKLQQNSEQVVMIGDGINDVPGLAAANVAITPLTATDLARAQSDALLLTNRLHPLSLAFIQARRARRIVRQNLGWAFGYNLCTIPLAAAGLIAPWLAAVGMSLSSLLVTLNASRLLRVPNQTKRIG